MSLQHSAPHMYQDWPKWVLITEISLLYVFPEFCPLSSVPPSSLLLLPPNSLMGGWGGGWTWFRLWQESTWLSMISDCFKFLCEMCSGHLIDFFQLSCQGQIPMESHWSLILTTFPLNLTKAIDREIPLNLTTAVDREIPPNLTTAVDREIPPNLTTAVDRELPLNLTTMNCWQWNSIEFNYSCWQWNPLNLTTAFDSDYKYSLNYILLDCRQLKDLFTLGPISKRPIMFWALWSTV